MVLVVRLREKGYAKSEWWGDLGREPVPELSWPASISVFDRMRSEAQVASVLRAVMLPILRATWRIDGAGCRPEVVAHVAQGLGLAVKGEEPTPRLRSKGRFSWTTHLRHALLSLVYGHAFFEQVYRVDENHLYQLRKLGWRPPRTISKVEVAPDGGLVAVEQYGGKARMEVGELVAYVNEREGGNWLGRSLLRPAYAPWLLKQEGLRVQAMTLDRNGLGVPLYKGSPPAEGLSRAQAAEERQKELDAGLEIASAVRAGDDAGVSVPHGADLVLRGVDGDLPNADPVIRYYDEQVARAVLAHFLNLGTETGSWALGRTFADFFVMALQTVAGDIADVTNQHVIEDLVDVNWGEAEPAPRLVFEEIGSKHPLTAEAIRSLTDSGVITPDDRLEGWVRDYLALPSQAADRAADPRKLAGIIQRIYPGVDRVVTTNEAREILRSAGAELPDPDPDPWPRRETTTRTESTDG
jgi:hypothetical protein